MFVVCYHKCNMFFIKGKYNKIDYSIITKKRNREKLNPSGKKDSVPLMALLLIKHARRKPENNLLIRIASK